MNQFVKTVVATALIAGSVAAGTVAAQASPNWGWSGGIHADVFKGD